MNERKVFKKLDGKDLINIGVFTAIYFVQGLLKVLVKSSLKRDL